MAKKVIKVAPSGADAGQLSDFEEGLDHLHNGRWATARKVFRKVSESNSGSPLADRCRQLMEVCDRRRAKGDGSVADPYLSAVVAKNDGDLEVAMEYCNRGGLKGKDPRFAYLAAAIEAASGNAAQAAALLARAIEMDSKNRVHAFWDPDFAEVREDPELNEIFDAE